MNLWGRLRVKQMLEDYLPRNFHSDNSHESCQLNLRIPLSFLIVWPVKVLLKRYVLKILHKQYQLSIYFECIFIVLNYFWVQLYDLWINYVIVTASSLCYKNQFVEFITKSWWTSFVGGVIGVDTLYLILRSQ